MNRLLRLTIPARPGYVVFARLVLTGLSRASKIDEEALADLKVVVTEMCSRSVGSRSNAAEIQIGYELTGRALRVTVESAAPAAPLAVDDVLQEAMRLSIARALVDDLAVAPRSHSGRSKVVLERRLRRAGRVSWPCQRGISAS